MAKVEKHGDKTRIAIEIMEANVGKSYEEVSQMIADAIGVDLNRAKVYYRHKVINGIAKGYDPDVRPWETRGPKVKAEKPAAKPVKAAKAPKVKAEKVKETVKVKEIAKIKEAKTVEAKPKGNRFTGKIKAEAKPKTADELAEIKEANLKRMQQVTAKMKKQGLMPGQYANPENVGVPDGWDADEARAEVAQMYKDLESFELPKFLSKDQVKALV